MSILRKTCLLSLLILSSVFCFLFSQDNTPLTPDSIKTAEKLVEEVYKDKLNLRRPDEIEKAGHELLSEAQNSKDDRAARYVLFLKALDLASKVTDIETVLAALDGLKEFSGNELAEKRNDILRNIAKRVREKKDILALVSVYSDMASQHEMKCEYEEAGDALKTAYGLARKSRDKDLVLELANRKKNLDILEKEFRSVKKALHDLAENENNAGANTTVGEFFCFVLGDWAKGLPYLSRGADEELKNLVLKDIELSKLVENDEVWGPDDIIKLADAWLERAEDERSSLRKGNMASRASVWYSEASGRLSGLKQKALESKILKAEKMAAEGSGTGAGTLPYGAVFVVTFNEDSIEEKDGRKYIPDLIEGKFSYRLEDGKLVRGKAGEGLEVPKTGQGTWVINYQVKEGFTPPLTMSVWIKMDSMEAVKGFGSRDILGSPSYTRLGFDRLKDKLMYMTSTKTSARAEHEPIEPGKWYHLAITVDAKDGEELSSEKVFFYMNGKQLTTASAHGKAETFALGNTRFGNQSFHGMIDEFAVFNRALSEKEIKGLYVMGKSGKTLMKAK